MAFASVWPLVAPGKGLDRSRHGIAGMPSAAWCSLPIASFMHDRSICFDVMQEMARRSSHPNGFMLHAAVPPLHAWLTDAYPEQRTGALLSALLPDGGLCLDPRLPWDRVAHLMGTFMALYGVVFAMLSNDIRRLFGYHHQPGGLHGDRRGDGFGSTNNGAVRILRTSCTRACSSWGRAQSYR